MLNRVDGHDVVVFESSENPRLMRAILTNLDGYLTLAKIGVQGTKDARESSSSEFLQQCKPRNLVARAAMPCRCNLTTRKTGRE